MSTPPLRLGLPVALHSDGEIAAFLAAKERIERLTRAYGILSDVGVFAFFTPRLMSPEQRARQLENQARHKLSIIHAQTPVQVENSLAYDAAAQSCFGVPSLLETAVNHVAQLRSLGPQVPCSVDTHAGIIALDGGGNPHPGIYGVDDFVARRTELYDRSKCRFDALAAQARTAGMTMVLENAFPAVMQPDYRGGEPLLQYLPFSDFSSTSNIASGSLVFDIAHWANAVHLPEQFRSNAVDPASLFATMDIASWDEYAAAVGTKEEYLAHAQAVHLSNTHGIGSRLAKYPQLENTWGRWGEIEGLVSRDDLRQTLLDAYTRELPVMIEVDYDLKNIPINKFSEADDFLSYLLRK